MLTKSTFLLSMILLVTKYIYFANPNTKNTKQINKNKL